MSETTLVPQALATISGYVYAPGTTEYDEARTMFNSMFDRRPALIVRCATSEDVVSALNYGRSNDLEVTVYGGGHGVAGTAVADGALCIDLRGMKRVQVDLASRTVQVEAGCTWGELDAATQADGLAVTGGRVTTTGVAGLALGSGSGWLERSFGYTCDNLLSAQVVTADGRVVTASSEENPDLFWGIRGGGGNFGIVTEFTLRVHPVGPLLLGGMLLFDATDGRKITSAWRDFMLEAPDAVGSGLVFLTAPPLDFVPEPLRGQPAVGMVLCYNGPVDEGQAAIQPLVELGPAVNVVQPMPYVAIQQLIDASAPKGMRNYWTADFYHDLPDEAIETLVGRATQSPSPMSSVIVVPGGGAIARVPDDATAFGNRDAQFNIHYLTMWATPNDDEVNINYTKEISAAMKPWSTGGVYLNFIGDEGTGRVKSAFGPDKWDRIRAIKRTWDPDNVFQHNQNIRPA